MRLSFLLLFSFLNLSAALADTPADLNPWRSWITSRHPEWNCAKDNSASLQCVFPGKVSFDLMATGASFTLHAELLQHGLLPIPGNAELPPTSVSVSSTDNKSTIAARLMVQNGEIFLDLPPGSYNVTGEIHWGSEPQEIPLNGQTGLVEIKSQEQATVLRSSSGFRITEQNSPAERDSLQIKVYRKFQDGSPLESQTAIQLRVSGAARPLQFGRVIPNNSTPIAIQSPLNFQLTKTGELTVELTPGEHEIRIRAVMGQPINEITVPKPTVPDWPEEEYWVWKPREELRTVEILDGVPASATVVNLPKDFSSVTAYAVSTSQLKLKELTRGEERQSPDNLRVSREFWLDLDGTNFSVKDNIQGSASSSMRLDVSNEVQLGRVTQAGEAAIVTLKEGAKGIELRDTIVNLEAISRLPNRGYFTSVGWNLESIEDVNISLHLPPSWELLDLSGGLSYGGISGGGSWTESWSLLEIFILSLLVLASYKLFGMQLALIFCASIILNHSQHLEPKMLYLHLFALFGLKKFFKHLSGVWRNVVTVLIVITFCALALEQLTFAKLQFTQALFPQLPAGTRFRTALQELIILNEETILFWPILLLAIGVAIFLFRWTFKDLDIWKMVGRLIVSGVVGILGISLMGGLVAVSHFGSSASRSGGYQAKSLGGMSNSNMAAEQLEMQDGVSGYDSPSSVPQQASGYLREKKASKGKSISLGNNTVVAGPTLPSWNWKSVTIVIPGPVTKEATLKLRLVPPSFTRVMCGLRAIIALLLSVLLFRGLGFSLHLRGLKVAPFALLFFLPMDARADFPTPDLLQELETQMVREQCQTAPCAQIKELSISLENKVLKLLLKVSSKGRSSVVLPGPLDSFTPSAVLISQKPTSKIRRNQNGFLEVVVEDGENSVEMSGIVPETFSIQFITRPLFTKADLKEFVVEGLSKEGTVENGLRFVKKDQTGKEKLTESVVLPNWVVVNREIFIAQQISITTTVERIGNATSSFSVPIPLLADERITSGVGVTSDKALTITFAPQVSSISYDSIIPFASDFKFTAESHTDTGLQQLSERWVVSCASYLTCSSGGILPTTTVSGTLKNMTWHPFPGESATIHVEQLGTLPGDFVAIDSMTNTLSFSESSAKGELSISARATQQASIELEAPAGIEIKGVKIDGRATNFSKLEFLLPPGSHQLEISYTVLEPQGIVTRAPQFRVVPQAHNISTRVRPNPERWLVWSSGDGWGPSVLYWSKLIVVVAICYLLSYFGLISLTTLSSVLLGIGLASLPLAVCIFPLGWLIWLQLPEHLVDKIDLQRRWLKITITAGLAVVSFVLFYEVVRVGLVLSPPMLVVGNSSNAQNLNWFVDHSGAILPRAQFISLSMWIWRAFSLVWSLWLVSSLIRWIKQSATKVLG